VDSEFRLFLPTSLACSYVPSQSALTQSERALAVANARQRATFKPHLLTHLPSATLETREENPRSRPQSSSHLSAGRFIRHSQRKHTILNTSAAATRARTGQVKKNQRPRTRSIGLTQVELLSQALDNEEGNLVQHRDYLKSEAQKRARIRPSGSNIQGPFIRWMSTSEGANLPSISRTSVRTSSKEHELLHVTPTDASGSCLAAPLRAATTTNFLVYSSGRGSKFAPSWETSMSTILGDHVQWQGVKVLSNSNGVSARPTRTCPMTGRQARYIDRRTNIPFANLEAYKVLSELLLHGFVWSDEHKQYVGEASLVRTKVPGVLSSFGC
jgi:hypothetical protein